MIYGGTRRRRFADNGVLGGVAAAVIGLVVGLIFALATRNEPVSPLATILASSGKVVAAGSSSVAVTIVTGPSDGQVTTLMTGNADYTNHTVQLTADKRSGKGDVVLSEVLAGGNVYIEQLSGPSLGVGTAARPWLEAPDKGLNAEGAANPQDIARLLQAASGKTVDKGQETSHGVTSTGYGVDLNFDAAASSAVGADKTFFSNAAATFNHAVTPADAWIDGQGRLTELRIAPPAASSGSAATHLDVQFFNFGTPTSIFIPPADQITMSGASH